MAEPKVRDVVADTIASLKARRASLVRLGRSTEAVDEKLAALRAEPVADTVPPVADSETPAQQPAAGSGAPADGDPQAAVDLTDQKSSGTETDAGSSTAETGTDALGSEQKEEDSVLEKKVEDQPLERAVPAGPSTESPAQVHARKSRAAGQRQQPPAKGNG